MLRLFSVSFEEGSIDLQRRLRLCLRMRLCREFAFCCRMVGTGIGAAESEFCEGGGLDWGDRGEVGEG